jgi:DNA repair protein RecN (Recombination protein N)
MLSELTVRNFALIDRLDLAFGPGFNVLTGETGAGKSILVGAVGLLSGGRASAEMIRDGFDEAEVSAVFLLPDPAAFETRFETLGLPAGEEVLVRRVISRSGRNRIYVNGASTTLAVLTLLGEDLLSISGQHEHQQLLDPDHQLLLLDQYGPLMAERMRMAEAHARLGELTGRCRELEKRARTEEEKADLAEFQVKEIVAAGLTEGEDTALERERTVIRNAARIFESVQGGYERLYGASGAVTEVLSAVRRDLDQAADLDERLREPAAQVKEAYHQLVDTARALENHLTRLTFDPARQEEIEERLVLIQRLKKKYGPTLGDVLDFERRAAAALDGLAELKRELELARGRAGSAGQEAGTLARELSEKRTEAAGRLAKAVTRELRFLGMPHLVFEIRFAPRAEPAQPGPTGWDALEFFMAPNKGESLKPLARIASGGELSRTLLGFKVLLAGQEGVQTLIFDEVDAGIGGGVAGVIGRKLRSLAAYHQVLCITHLPQIAAFARHHHQVFKEIRGERTVTDIRPLNDEERIEEIARMLGGPNFTARALDAAREMAARADEAPIDG